MNEKINSAIEGVKDIAEKVHISDKIHEVGDKIKESVSEIDIKETIGQVADKYQKGGINEAVHAVTDKIKEAAGKTSDAVKEGLRDFPGMAVDTADGNKVNEKMVDDRTKCQNNNPRNSDL